MYELVKGHKRFFAVFTALALVLRLFFIVRYPAFGGDSITYGKIAKNWMQHGVYGGNDEQGNPDSTMTRLPGYPGFLATIWSVAGVGNFTAVLYVQLLIDLVSCFVIADIARRLLRRPEGARGERREGPEEPSWSTRAALAAFALAAICPFTANYVSTPMTETASILCVATAFDCALIGLTSLRFGWWVGCGLAVGGTIYLRPDGVLLPLAIGAWGWVAFWRAKNRERRLQLARRGLVLVAVSVMPLVPWTIRNWRVFHEFQPLVPRYCSDPGGYDPVGLFTWAKTWMGEFTSVTDFWWRMPGYPVEFEKLPSRAFDSSEQREKTRALLADYNRLLDVDERLDARFKELVKERVEAHPLRHYGWLPALRLADMWLRPRTEYLPWDVRWWNFAEHPKQSAASAFLAVANLGFLILALLALIRLPVPKDGGMLLLFVLFRSLFLMFEMENPEPRFTMVCYPVVLVFAAYYVASRWRRGRADAAVATT